MPRPVEEWLVDLEDPARRRSWKYRDLEAALQAGGAVIVSQKGSHRTFKYGDFRDLVTLVDRRNQPVPIGYVKDVAKLLRRIVEARNL